ncbi:MFS transporter [Nocardioides sp. KIGAM211]|uniref:MFS transporter n=1 Tax=Nocardioides luti TaxID=2761101 RepID=A0A7X0V9X9_9ACTN|nr:MFS transporter [Nocardioides luti]
MAAHPVLVASAVAAVLHVLWWWLLANSGGDIAAQDAWAEFARDHPGSAYTFAWYGGMHPVSYSVLSPYLMAALGVRTTMMVAGTLSSGLLALLLVRSRAIERPLWPALYGALAFAGNAVSGRVTFGLGALFALAAVAVVFAWPSRWRTDRRWHRVLRGLAAALLAATATAASPVAGLFLGIAAAALWLDRRRPAAYALGVPPVLVVALSAWLFPFSGQQPMHFGSAVLPFLTGVALWLLAPKGWRSVRIGAAVYAVAVLAVWLIPSPIGTNVSRLGLTFGGVLLVAVATRRRRTRPLPVRRWVSAALATVLLAVAITTSTVWQVATAARDAITTSTPAAWAIDIKPLIAELARRDARFGRVEVVPSRSHAESSALAPYANLARGWNRQADAERNPLFYGDELLTPTAYHDWLHRWAVHYVVLPVGAPDAAAAQEAALVASGLPYLRHVWSNASWRLYEVRDPAPLADEPAVVTSFDATGVTLYLPRAADVVVRIPDSPWLSLLDGTGSPIAPPEVQPDLSVVNVDGCLSIGPVPAVDGQPEDDWTVLHAPKAGTYRIAAPYKLPRGTACPDAMLEPAAP